MPAEAREAMLEPIADAIAAAVSEPVGGFDARTLAAAALSIGWHESRFASYVIEGRCTDGPAGARCDLDRHGKPRARGPWQVWRVACPAAYAHPAGSRESLEAEASCAVRLVAGAYYRCRSRHPHSDWAGAFSGYGGIVCTRPNSPARARTMSGFRARLEALLAVRGPPMT
jgi:hypothetical protein